MLLLVLRTLKTAHSNASAIDEGYKKELRGSRHGRRLEERGNKEQQKSYRRLLRQRVGEAKEHNGV